MRGVPTIQDRNAQWYDLSSPSLDKREYLKSHRQKMNNGELLSQPLGLGRQTTPNFHRHMCIHMPTSSPDRRPSL